MFRRKRSKNRSVRLRIGEPFLPFAEGGFGTPSGRCDLRVPDYTPPVESRFGSAELKQKYLPAMITMDHMGSYCLTEPSSGSDAAALKTRAVFSRAARRALPASVRARLLEERRRR